MKSVNNGVHLAMFSFSRSQLIHLYTKSSDNNNNNINNNNNNINKLASEIQLQGTGISFE
jgi:hypothetical protein